MDAGKMAVIPLIVGGVPGLAYGGLSYTKQTHEVEVAPIELSIKDKQTV